MMGHRLGLTHPVRLAQQADFTEERIKAMPNNAKKYYARAYFKWVKGGQQGPRPNPGFLTKAHVGDIQEWVHDLMGVEKGSR